MATTIQWNFGFAWGNGQLVHTNILVGEVPKSRENNPLEWVKPGWDDLWAHAESDKARATQNEKG